MSVTIYRAGGTDVQERLRSGRSHGTVVDIGTLPVMAGRDAWEWADGGLRIGALTPLDRIVADERIAAAYPGLTEAAGIVATPQIRRAATLGGALAQRTRCWYYRNERFSCFKSGGDGCPARDGGDQHLSVCVDLGPCVAPHPSTVGMALLAHDNVVIATDRRERLTVEDLYGDGSDPARDHLLDDGEMITTVTLPAPLPGERAAYRRAVTRHLAEWPLVEALARLTVADGAITSAAVAVGGIAPVPLRLPEVETSLVGFPPTPDVLAAASRAAQHRMSPLPGSVHKVALVPATLLDVLTRAAG